MVHDLTFEACSGFTHVAACRMLNRPRRPLSRGFDQIDCSTRSLVSYQVSTDNPFDGSFLQWRTAPLGH
jgi:hypothetical protein